MQRAQEPVESPGPPPSSPDYRMVHDKKLARRPPGRRLAVAALVVPAALTAGGGFLAAPAAEESLARAATAALRAEGLRGVKVSADGPFLTAYVPTNADPIRVSEVVEGVAGVSTVVTERVYTSKKEEKACTDLKGKLDRATGKQRIPFAGRTDRLTSTGQRMVVAAAELVAACGSARVYVGGHTDPTTPQGSALSIRRARRMIDVMRKAGVAEERMLPRGYAAQYPVSDGDSAAARQRNERGSVVPVEG